MATFEDVDSAAKTLNASLGKQDWLLGVGVGKSNDEFVVAVRSTKDMPVGAIPATISGIPVIVETRQMPVAQ